MSFFDSKESISLLDSIGENIFVVDTNFDIVWINKFADILIKRISPYTHLHTKEEYIGLNMNEFHSNGGRKQREIMNGDIFPYETTIELFGRFSASLSISPFTIDGEVKGYIVTWEDVTEYEEIIKSKQQLLEEMYAPVIETSIDGVLLVPVVGTLNEVRIAKKKEKIMQLVEKQETISIIFDFTGLVDLTEPDLLFELRELENTLYYMGVQVIFTGIKSNIANKIANHSSGIDVKIFPSFKIAMRYIWDNRGLALVKKGE